MTHRKSADIHLTLGSPIRATRTRAINWDETCHHDSPVSPGGTLFQRSVPHHYCCPPSYSDWTSYRLATDFPSVLKRKVVHFHLSLTRCTGDLPEMDIALSSFYCPIELELLLPFSLGHIATKGLCSLPNWRTMDRHNTTRFRPLDRVFVSPEVRKHHFFLSALHQRRTFDHIRKFPNHGYLFFLFSNFPLPSDAQFGWHDRFGSLFCERDSPNLENPSMGGEHKTACGSRLQGPLPDVSWFYIVATSWFAWDVPICFSYALPSF